MRVVLCNPTDPRNVGGAARAVANFGFTELRVVGPPVAEEDVHAYSAGAVERIVVRTFADVDAAIADCARVVGTSRRSRDADGPPEWPVAGLAERLRGAGRVAVLFGTERTGLTTEELDRCAAVVAIHTADLYPSMNLAHAVACVGFELTRPVVGERGPPVVAVEARTSAGARAAFFGHVEAVVRGLGYPPGRSASAFTRRVRRILERANPDQQELSLLGGVFTELRRLGRLAGTFDESGADESGADESGVDE